MNDRGDTNARVDKLVLTSNQVSLAKLCVYQHNFIIKIKVAKFFW